jgi:AP-2 complex subunit alpha
MFGLYCVLFSIRGDTGIGHVQIGVKADWRGLQGRLILFIGNKHTGSLSNVKVVVLPPSHLRFQSPPVPDAIPPRAQVSL